MLIEMLLQLLIGIVDAELLKTIGLERLKAKDIENTEQVDMVRINITLRFHLRMDVLIDFTHNPIEEAAIDCLCS